MPVPHCLCSSTGFSALRIHVVHRFNDYRSPDVLKCQSHVVCAVHHGSPLCVFTLVCRLMPTTHHEGLYGDASAVLSVQFIMVFGLVNYMPLTYDSYVYPPGATVIGWSIALSSILCIPGFALYSVLMAKGSLSKVGLPLSLSL